MTKQVQEQMLMFLLLCMAREDRLLKHSSSAGGVTNLERVLTGKNTTDTTYIYACTFV